MTASPSDRVREVAALVAEGLTNQRIADHLELSVDTVKHHVGDALKVYRVTNRTQLALAVRDAADKAAGAPRGWELVALVARSGDPHWAGKEVGGSRRLCVHTAADPLGWDVPAEAVALMPPMPLTAEDHSGSEAVTYRRLRNLPLVRPATRRAVA